MRNFASKLLFLTTSGIRLSGSISTHAESLDFSYRAWRERFLQIILGGTTIFGFIALVFSAAHRFRLEQPALAFGYIGAWLLLLLISVTRLPYKTRAGTFLLLVFGLGLSSLMDGGLKGDARLVFLVFSLMAALLVRPWAGIAALGASLLAMGIVAALRLDGVIGTGALSAHPDPWAWFVGSLGLVLTAAACLTAVILLVEAFDAAQERLQKTLANLRESHASMEETAERLRRMAYYDPATGLPNGLQLETDMAALYPVDGETPRRRLALAGFRLTGLKRLNEKQGMEVTSRIISEILRSYRVFLQGWMESRPGLRPPEPLQDMYRAEANTFVFMFSAGEADDPPTPVDDDLFAAALRDSLARMDMAGRLDFQGGYSIYPDDAPSLPQLVRNLLNLLHSDPDAGPGRFTAFNPAKYGEYLRKEQIRQSFKLAMDKGEFFMVFQPKVKVTTGAVGGFEALARWESPTLGKVSPIEFIPLAEQYGEIEALSRRLFRDAWRFIHALRKENDRHFRVSVNLSALLLNHQYLEDLIEEVSVEGLGPYLELEITESSLMNLTPAVEAQFARLKDMGVGFSIDDFGTGYSNLGYLQKFQPDVLKIDKSFIDGIPLNDKSGTLVKAIVHMARSFDMAVVAEGVEYEVQRDFLVSNDCDLIQGYLCSKPLAFDDALAFYRQ